MTVKKATIIKISILIAFILVAKYAQISQKDIDTDTQILMGEMQGLNNDNTHDSICQCGYCMETDF